MRIVLFIIILGTFIQNAFAANDHVTPIVKEVTVYRSGAKITSVAKVTVPAGKSEVTFENLSPYFNPQSLQVRLGGNVTLNAAVFQLKVPAPAPELPRIKIIRDSIVLLNDAVQTLNDETDVYNRELNLVTQGAAQIGTIPEGSKQPKLTVAELQQLADYYRSRIMEIKKLSQKVSISIRNTQKRLQALNDELRRLNPNTSDQSGEIVMKVESPSAQTIEIACTYLVQNAYWRPLYDLKSDGLDQPLKLVYKANVINQTGFDWKNVKLALSSAMPLVNNDRPILQPIFVDFKIYNNYQYDQNIKADMARSNTNIYQMKEVAPMMAGAAPGVEISEGLIDATDDGGAPDEFLSTFEITKPQDIASDGQENIITVEEREMAATYQYHAVPKVEPAVFLLAKVPDYGKYNLLPGTANIFFKETFVGQTTVNPNVTSDTLLLSLGRDDQITIKRVQPKDFTDRKKVLSNSIKETYAFEITVKNNKPLPINIEIIDQIPVSKQETIQVELIDKDGAEYAETYGKLTWKLDIKPGQNKKVKFSYSVKYPKDKNIGIQKF